MRPRLMILLAICVALLGATSAPAAEPGPEAPFWAAGSFYVENDVLSGTDQHYTNAVKLTLVSRDLNTRENRGRMLRYLPGLGSVIDEVLFPADPEKTRNIQVSLGNDIYTPVDVKATQLITDDRPYAGWTYASLALHAKDHNRLDTFELTAGIVGPSAQSDFIQNEFHRLIDTFPSEGWKNQLRDEPGLMVSWQRRYRHATSLGDGPWGADFVPHLGLTAGNVFTHLSVGGQVRLGYNLPRDFGVSPLQTGSVIGVPARAGDPVEAPWGINVFAGVDGRAVARNIFLDGNTFRHSHRVDKLPFVADVYGGVSLLFNDPVLPWVDHWGLTYTHVYRSREFVGQDDGQVFGSFNVFARF